MPCKKLEEWMIEEWMMMIFDHVRFSCRDTRRAVGQLGTVNGGRSFINSQGLVRAYTLRC